jgi:Nucleotidyl transferase of unknown function (DUF2204)
MRQQTNALRRTAGEGESQGSLPAVRVHYPEDLERFIPEAEWHVYRGVLRRAAARGLRFAMSGGFASSFYTAMWRNTKDMDLCVVPQDREAMIEATREAGLHDLYEEKPYDRRWIYRSTHEGIIVDVIWRTANMQGDVDQAWTTFGPEVTLYGETVRLVPPEEMIWSKIHIVQRERCDWTDIINMLYATGARLDWSRLLGRVRGEERLLASVLLLFSWVAPGAARAFPEWIWERLGITRPEAGPQRDDDRIARLDSRPWFSPLG